MNKHIKSAEKSYQHASDCLPSSLDAKKTMQARAKLLAIRSDKKTETNNKVPYIRFKLGKNEYYGIPFSEAREVMRNQIITRAPKSPPYIAGVINHRGILLPVIELNHLFNLESVSQPISHIIVVETSNRVIGILANHIEGSHYYDPQKLDEPLPVSGDINLEHIIGLDQGVTAILNMEKLLKDCT